MSHDLEHAHTDNNVEQQAGYYQGSDWSLPYMSPWSRIHADPQLASVLQHMNCSYLGQPGAPPTLLGLKQHAQSLAKLIMLLDPSVNVGEVDGARLGVHEAPGSGSGSGSGDAKRRLEAGSAFDWLADLGTPHTNDDPNHHRPLNALLNEVRGRHDIGGTSYHCPLTEVSPRQPKEKMINEYYLQGVMRRPFASHHNLVMHANECLERLDHEFSATGGLLSLVPPDDGKEDGTGSSNDNNKKPSAELTALKNSLLGQFLMFCQGLCVRTHEMQIQHARLLDVMAGEAVAPAQELSRNGPDARKGRAVVFPQDRWILANAGDDVFDTLHGLLDKEEAKYQEVMKQYKASGVSGTIDWELHRGGSEYARGIVPVHIMTRYYRLAGKGRSTIFVIPAADHHPGLEATRDLVEKKPTVVSVVQPRWPERVSAWEAKYKKEILRATETERDLWRLQREKDDRDRQLKGLQHELERQARIAEAATEMLVKVRGQGGDPQEDRAELERQLRDQQAIWVSSDTRRREQRKVRDADKYLQALRKAQRLAMDANPQSELVRHLGNALRGAGGVDVVGDDQDDGGMDLS